MISEKYSENVDGVFYVNLDCIGCDTCVNIAPAHFKLTKKNEQAFVCFQPENQEENRRCEEAQEKCPVEAISN